MLNFKTTLLKFGLILLFAPQFLVYASEHKENKEELRNKATLSKMEKLINQYHLPSLSVSIGISEEIVFAQALGFKDVESGTLATRNTQYSIGSLAKPMTGIALAKLVDSGKVSLDSKVNSYVKDLIYTESFTIRQLASHTAGIPHNTPEREVREFIDVKDHSSPFEVLDVFSNHPLLFKPGTNFEYSSNGYILLSAAIEKISGQNYVEFIKSSLLSEFKMLDTELDTSVAGQKNEAIYYSGIDERGNFIRANTKRDRSFLFGGGGFISTPSDMVKMAQAMYDEKYLSKSIKDELYSPVKLNNGKANSQNYSIGWRVGEIRIGKSKQRKFKVVHHGGVTDNAATAYLLVVPACKASIAFTTNILPNKFWKLRPQMAELLKIYIDPDKCINI